MLALCRAWGFEVIPRKVSIDSVHARLLRATHGIVNSLHSHGAFTSSSRRARSEAAAWQCSTPERLWRPTLHSRTHSLMYPPPPPGVSIARGGALASRLTLHDSGGAAREQTQLWML